MPSLSLSLSFCPSSLHPREVTPLGAGRTLLEGVKAVTRGREADAPLGSISVASPGVVLSGFIVFPSNTVVLRLWVLPPSLEGMWWLLLVSPSFQGGFPKGGRHLQLLVVDLLVWFSVRFDQEISIRTVL